MIEDQVIIIGTAHVSEESMKEVEDAILSIKPKYVALELDQKRYDNLIGKTSWKDEPLYNFIKGDKLYSTLANYILGTFQRKIGKQLKIIPGSEMLSAIRAAKKVNSEILLIDKDVSITFKCLFREMPFFEKVRVMKEFLGTKDISLKEITDVIEGRKNSALIDELLAQLKKISPTGYKILVKERDIFMANKIIEKLNTLNKNEKIVVVVGAAHKDAILTYLNNPKLLETKSISNTKSYFSLSKVLLFLLPIFIFSLLLISYFKFKQVEDIYVWILLHSIFSALGVIIAGGCILAIVTALIFAPFTPFIWFINVGFLAGLVELFYRKVTFTDIENLKKTSSFKQLFKNKMFRVLLLAALANLGNMISSIIFVIQWVIRHITKL